MQPIFEENGIRVREITAADDAALAGIIRANLEKAHLDIPGTAYFDETLDHLSCFYLSAPTKRAYLVAETADGQILGGVGLAEFEGMDDCAELQKLYLSDAAKGHGLGKRLMQLITDRAKALGYHFLYLETHTNLTTAIHLYERLDFRPLPRPVSAVHSTMNCFFIKEL